MNTLNTLTTVEVLKAAKEIIQDPANWTQETYFEVRNDKQCFCALGAIAKAKGITFFESSGDPSAGLLKSVVGYDLGLNESFAVYNDNHTHAEVMEAFDKAIALANNPV